MKTNLTKQQMNALYRCADNNGLRPVMSGVFHENGKMIVSNGHILMAIEAEYPAENEGKIIDKNGKVIEGRYPNWQSVIPNGGELVSMDTKELFQAVKNIRTIKARSINGSRLQIGEYFYKSELLFKILSVIKDYDFEIYQCGETRPMIFKGEHFTAIIMPTIPGDTDKTNNDNLENEGVRAIFSIGEALQYKPFEKIKFVNNGEIVQGEKIGSFRANGLTFDVVMGKRTTHSVLNGVSQTSCYTNYIDFSSLIELTEAKINDKGIKTKDFDIPERLSREVYCTDRADGFFVPVVKNATLINKKTVNGIDFEITSFSKTYYLTYAGFSIASNNYDNSFSRELEMVENGRFTLQNIEDFIYNTYLKNAVAVVADGVKVDATMHERISDDECVVYIEKTAYRAANGAVIGLYIPERIEVEPERTIQEKPEAKRDYWAEKLSEVSEKYPYINLYNITPMELGRLEKSLKKLWRFDGVVMSMSEYLVINLNTFKDKHIYTEEYTRSGELRAKPKITYNLHEQNGCSMEIDKIIYDRLMLEEKADVAA